MKKIFKFIAKNKFETGMFFTIFGFFLLSLLTNSFFNTLIIFPGTLLWFSIMMRSWFEFSPNYDFKIKKEMALKKEQTETLEFEARLARMDFVKMAQEKNK